MKTALLSALVLLVTIVIVPAAPAAAVCHGISYTVAQGDSLSGIARRFGSNAQAIAKASGIAMNSILHPGDVVCIPTGGGGGGGWASASAQKTCLDSQAGNGQGTWSYSSTCLDDRGYKIPFSQCGWVKLQVVATGATEKWWADGNGGWTSNPRPCGGWFTPAATQPTAKPPAQAVCHGQAPGWWGCPPGCELFFSVRCRSTNWWTQETRTWSASGRGHCQCPWYSEWDGFCSERCW